MSTTQSTPIPEGHDPIPYQRRSARHRPKTASKSSRMAYIDAAKGLAILFVVMGHILRAEGNIISPEIDGNIDSVIYAFHMPLFFFVTGYCRALSERKALLDGKRLGSTCGKLALRLLPAYLLWTFIYFLARLITEPADPATWLTITLTFRGVAPLWFLGDLLLSELVFLVVQWAARGRWQIHAAAAALFGAVTVPACTYMWAANEEIKAQAAAEAAEAAANGIPAPELAYVPGEHIIPYLQITGARMLPTLFFLFCGYLAARLLSGDRLPAPVHLLLGAVGLTLTPLLQINLGNSINLHLCTVEKPALFLLTGLLGALGTLELCRGLSSILPLWILQALGRHSMGIMALHYPPLPTMEFAAAWCLLLNPGLSSAPVAFLLAQTAMTAAVCSLVTFFIQKKLFL